MKSRSNVSRPNALLFCLNTLNYCNGNDNTSLIFVCTFVGWMYGCNGRGAKQTARTFAFIAACCASARSYNFAHSHAILFVKCMERLSCWPTLHERTARTFVFVVNTMGALVIEGVIIGVASTKHDVIIFHPHACATLLSNNILSSCWPWTNSAYVIRLFCCACAGTRTCYWCSTNVVCMTS